MIPSSEQTLLPKYRTGYRCLARHHRPDGRSSRGDGRRGHDGPGTDRGQRALDRAARCLPRWERCRSRLARVANWHFAERGSIPSCTSTKTIARYRYADFPRIDAFTTLHLAACGSGMFPSRLQAARQRRAVTTESTPKIADWLSKEPRPPHRRANTHSQSIATNCKIVCGRGHCAKARPHQSMWQRRYAIVLARRPDDPEGSPRCRPELPSRHAVLIEYPVRFGVDCLFANGLNCRDVPELHMLRINWGESIALLY